jgi:hypothetical protein
VTGWVRLTGVGGPGIALGDWFAPPEQAVRTAAGDPFSRKQGNRKCVVLLEEPGPTTPVWARTSDLDGGGVQHDAHPQARPHGPCRINLDGRVCTHVRCTVKTSELERSYSCSEPADSPLWVALDRWPSE